MKKFTRTYEAMVTIENLLSAWQVFLPGKKNKKDVALFEAKLMDHVLELYAGLCNKTYIHGSYQAFNISDPKPRNIHKATVRDRLLHHLIYQELYTYFDSHFIYDSYSCRLQKGTHRALRRFEQSAIIVSRNYTKTCYVLKCDIRKFFANINHEILKSILAKYIQDKDIIWLLGQVIDSFNTEGKPGVGLPLGNLTSQLLVNVYMNEFDQFVKHQLKVKFYMRYADDFVLFSQDKNYLYQILSTISTFLDSRLRLTLHPNKVSVQTVASGVDFLGWVHFPYHITLRTSTKHRMLKKLNYVSKQATLSSYLGMLKHGNTYALQEKVKAVVAVTPN